MKFDNETFMNNGDNSKDSISIFGSDIMTDGIADFQLSGVLASPSGSRESSTHLGKSLITIKRSFQVTLS